MPTDTHELIRRLAADVTAVRPLPRPWVRAAVWLALAIPYVGVVAVVMSLRNDLVSRMTEPRFVTEVVTALAAGVVAAVAAFATVVPGYSRRWLVLLLVLFAAWMGVLGRGCIQDWVQSGPDGVLLKTDWSCFPAILLAGGVPAIAMAVMLRRGAPLTPILTMVLGGLAAGGLADAGLRFHHREAGVMVVAWHLAAVVVLCTVPGLAGRRVLRWRA